VNEEVLSVEPVSVEQIVFALCFAELTLELLRFLRGQLRPVVRIATGKLDNCVSVSGHS